MPLERHPTANGKCQAKTKAGRPCAAPVLSGSAFCSLHADPERAAALGRKGGARNRKVYDGDVHNVSVPESAGDVKRMLAETMADTRAGKIDPKLGSTLGYLDTALLRAFEVADFEQRLEWRAERREPSCASLKEKNALGLGVVSKKYALTAPYYIYYIALSAAFWGSEWKKQSPPLCGLALQGLPLDVVALQCANGSFKRLSGIGIPSPLARSPNTARRQASLRQRQKPRSLRPS